ncbi:parafibromin isoform X4 [Parasteatoda tepidariorum]|uniref:parafibromin isoform X4 n=1 Tax=Parasteatoda tepidariorum TaxID=114398 RepID=UPI001C727C95|nr:parafibromin isoform X3 [Parasteatoda tepidariorum]
MFFGSTIFLKSQLLNEIIKLFLERIHGPKQHRTIIFSGKDGTQKKYYTLECLLYFIKNASLSHPKYVEQAAAENIPAVRRPDRKKLLAYLKGDSSTMSSSIDKNGPIKDITIVYDKEAEIETNELRAKLGLIKSEETNNSSKIIDISKGRF